MDRNYYRPNYNASIIEKLLLLGIIGGGGVFLDRYLKKKKEEKTLDDFGTDSNVQIAIAIRKAINPSGLSWMMPFEGVDFSLVSKEFSKIKDYKKVASAYRTMYGRDLTTDLRSNLSNAQFSVISSIINTGTTTGGSTTDDATRQKAGLISLKAGDKIYSAHTNQIKAIEVNNGKYTPTWGIKTKTKYFQVGTYVNVQVYQGKRYAQLRSVLPTTNGKLLLFPIEDVVWFDSALAKWINMSQKIKG